MSVTRPSPTSPERGPAAPRRGGKRGVRRPNRAELQAMEARAAATRQAHQAAVAGDTRVEDERPARIAPRGQTGARARVRAPKIITMSREQEYQLIRHDLNRLLITATALLVLMLALLFIVEG